MTEALDFTTDAEFWAEYERRCEALKEPILKATKQADGALNGRRWADEHGIPEPVFADVVSEMDAVNWGVSPMYPWYDGDDAEQDGDSR